MDSCLEELCIKINVLKGVKRGKTVRSNLKFYEPKREKMFNNYIISLITIKLLNKQNNSYFKY